MFRSPERRKKAKRWSKLLMRVRPPTASAPAFFPLSFGALCPSPSLSSPEKEKAQTSKRIKRKKEKTKKERHIMRKKKKKEKKEAKDEKDAPRRPEETRGDGEEIRIKRYTASATRAKQN